MLADHENPASVGSFLPRVERIDEIESRPRHIHRRIRQPCAQGILHDAQTLIEGKPRRASMTGQQVLLLIGRIEAESKCGVPGHLKQAPTTHRHVPEYSASRIGGVSTVEPPSRFRALRVHILRPSD